MAVSSLYSELPLMGSQVRILTVEPGEYGETVRTKLRVGYLLHESGALLLGDTYPVQYQALSYRWGPKGEPTVEISCNYWSLFIGQSAFQALAHLRHDWQLVNVWIDAICINQEDFMEKAVQVPRMRDIYANAEEVVVWLGQGDQQIRDLLDRLAHTPDTATARKAAEIDGLGDQLEDLCVCSASGPKTSEELVESMQALLCFPWFSRVWCKQEIWAARKASLHYEDISCEWQNFDVDFFERMVASTTGDVQSVPGMTAARQSLTRVRNQLVRADSATLASVRDKDKCNHYLSEDCKLDIVNVIRRYYGSQCKDERDHVYGLMGMSSVNKYIHEEDDKRNEMLSVDYSRDQSTAKTYEDLARYVIGRDDRLSILFLEGIFDYEQPRGIFTKQPLPTWVPDWRRDYGSLNWLISRVAKPLSEEQLPLVQQGPPITVGTRSISGVRFPLLLCGFRIGIFSGETLSAEWSSTSNGLRHAEIVHMKTGVLSLANPLHERLTERLPSNVYPGFSQDGVSSSDTVWAVPKRAMAGDIAIAGYGAYAPLLVRQSTDNVAQFTLIGPTVLPDDAYPFTHDEKAGACLTQKRSPHLLRLCASGKDVTDHLREILQVVGVKGEHFEII